METRQFAQANIAESDDNDGTNAGSNLHRRLLISAFGIDKDRGIIGRHLRLVFCSIYGESENELSLFNSATRSQLGETEATSDS